MAELQDFLEDVAGQGFEGMDRGDTTTPLLLVSQAMSQVSQEGKIPVGHFYNSVTGKDYGSELDVIVCHFEKVWMEWKPNQGGLVGRWKVGELEGVTGDVYTGMKHGENDVIETLMYLVVLPEHLEEGLLVFSSTRGNMRYLKGWNTALKYLRTPTGKPAPLFGGIWHMVLNKDKNKAGNTYYSCNDGAGKSSIKFVQFISKEMFDEVVQPVRQVAASSVARIDANQITGIESSVDEDEDED